MIRTRRRRRSPGRGFTIIELLVVVAVISLLFSILLPAVSRATDTGRVTKSLANLRNLGTAHASYAAEWNDRQFTLIADNISIYGDDPASAFGAYAASIGEEHPPVYLGWGRRFSSDIYTLWILESTGWSRFQPISFVSENGTGGERFGSFRLPNVKYFNRYLGGRFYEPTFYAPKDLAVMDFVRQAFESPDEYSTKETQEGDIAWSSYCMSPAAMFTPAVMRNPTDGGWQDPWQVAAGFRSPTFSQCRYPTLKTHMLEHHWLQNRRVSCSPHFDGGTYGNCEPYYFNHSGDSVPMTLFYDGHTVGVGVREAQSADARHVAQAQYGLWSRDTSWGDDGYFISLSHDEQANTSFHVFTTDGILGRDILSD